MKKEANHDENFEDTWMNKKDEWIDYVKNDVLVLCTVFGCARYSKEMEKIWNEKQCNFTIVGMELFS